VLLKYFHKVIVVYKALDKGYRDAISNITQLMGEGMAEYAEKLGQMPTIAEYDTYCHHVAGLVGWGLSDLFSASKLEDADLKDCKQISNSMGLFLQKTNIIRDYLEDLEEGRTWWPEEIWSQYAGSLADFKDKPDEAKSLACLNHMVSDALLLVPEALEYMRKLKNPQIFSFCAIPQVMAFATLEKVYNNTQVFKGVVKVRKGLSAKMMLNCGDMQAVNNYFNSLASKMQASAKKAQDKRVQNQLTSIRASCPPSYNMSYATLKQVHMVALVTLIWLLTACPCCSEGVTDCLCSASGALCAVLALTCFAFVFNIGFKMSAF
jgi:farnesyl-diphosphate farnesyltransferase